MYANDVLKPSTEFSLGIVCSLVLVLLDKAGKLTSGWALFFSLVVIAGLLGHSTIPWVMAAPSSELRFWRGCVAVAVILLAVSRFGIWLSPALRTKPLTAADAPSTSTVKPIASTVDEGITPNLQLGTPESMPAHSTRDIPMALGKGAPSADTFIVLVLPVSNLPIAGRKVADAKNVRAIITAREITVAGFWLNSQSPEISIPVGAAAQELVLVIQRRSGDIWLVNDRRPTAREDERQIFNKNEVKNLGGFGCRVVITVDGRVAIDAWYNVRPRPLMAQPAPR